MSLVFVSDRKEFNPWPGNRASSFAKFLRFTGFIQSAMRQKMLSPEGEAGKPIPQKQDETCWANRMRGLISFRKSPNKMLPPDGEAGKPIPQRQDETCWANRMRGPIPIRKSPITSATSNVQSKEFTL